MFTLKYKIKRVVLYGIQNDTIWVIAIVFFYYECAIHEVVPKLVAIAVNIVMAKWMFFVRVLFHDL